MPDDYNIYIDTPNAGIVPTVDANEFDPLCGYGPAMKSYAAQNPVVLETSATRDYSVSLFSTAPDQLFVQYQNNLTAPITRRINLDNSKLKDCIKIDGLGVYIIERYTFNSTKASVVEELLDYYINSVNIAYDKSTVDDIIKTLSDAVTVKRRILRTEIRILTYVSIDKIKYNQYTYVNGSGVVIVHGVPPEGFKHPYSPAYLENSLLSPVDDTGSVTIDISIIDSDKKPYYYMLGNKIHSIRPLHAKQATSLPSGCTITTKRGKNVVDDMYFTLEEFQENGFYRSKELCANNGDKSLMVAEASHKLQLEQSKLGLEKSKLELKKVQDSNTKLRLEKDYYIATKRIDLQYLMVKYRLDVTSRMLDIRTTGMKANLDMIKTSAEFNRAEALHSLKMADQSVKLLSTLVGILK